MPRSSTEQPRLRLPAHCRHCHRASGDGSRLPRRATCSRPRARNTPLAKWTKRAKEILSPSRRSTGPQSTSCQTSRGSISYGRTGGDGDKIRCKRCHLSPIGATSGYLRGSSRRKAWGSSGEANNNDGAPLPAALARRSRAACRHHRRVQTEARYLA